MDISVVYLAVYPPVSSSLYQSKRMNSNAEVIYKRPNRIHLPPVVADREMTTCSFERFSLESEREREREIVWHFTEVSIDPVIGH